MISCRVGIIRNKLKALINSELPVDQGRLWKIQDEFSRGSLDQ